MDVISVHVPKSAGSTIGNYLTRLYGSDRVLKDYDDYPMNPLSKINRDRKAWRISAESQIRSIPVGFKAVHGHFVIEKYHGHFPKARRIAWVRHPVSWVISLYYFWKNKPVAHTQGTNPLIVQLQTENLGLLEFAEDPTIRNCISRIFLGRLAPEEYDFLGVQEHFEDDFRDLCELMDWPQVDPGFENKSPEPAYGERLREIRDDPRIVQRIVELNEQDLALYETALRLRSRRLNSSWARYERHQPGSSTLFGLKRGQDQQSTRVA